ncbi:MAG TPA: D-Ala-D-Ala carboxypeptidase family metallohydrolase [Candidatus Paceibacterota bacterium]|nr:D-Ala-D-Ala carboxypeptidase family metallohydrolase [Candidatus Paceibacterota bacterium]
MRKFIFTLIFLLIPIASLAAIDAVYRPLAPLPDASGNMQNTIKIDNKGEGNNVNLEKYFKNLYRLGIVVATGLAVIMVMWGGIEYITSDALGGKEEGKEKIQNAFMGLLLALGSYLILRTIDPNLVNVKLDIMALDRKKLELLEGKVGKLEFEAMEKHDDDPNAPIGAGAVAPGAFDQDYYPGSESLPGLDYYRGQGPVAVKDNGGNPGFIDPTIAWMKDKVPGIYPWAIPSSTFRSQAWNEKIGGSKTSAHTRGQAIDFFSKNNSKGIMPVAEGENLVQWALQHAQALGLRQIIFNKKNYKASNNWIPVPITSMPHLDHVHIGR